MIILDDIGDVGGDEHIRIGLAHFLTNGLSAIADRFKNAKLMEIADQVLAPAAASNYSYAGVIGGRRWAMGHR